MLPTARMAAEGRPSFGASLVLFADIHSPPKDTVLGFPSAAGPRPFLADRGVGQHAPPRGVADSN
jgi:hypothetical protein